jgi:uncharacterized protein YjiS (DUF1127 family)
MLTLIFSRLIRAWRARASRRALGRLDAHRLRDLALTPEEVARETAKPFWRR